MPKTVNKESAAYYRVFTPEPGKGYKVEGYNNRTNSAYMTGMCTEKDIDTKNGLFIFYDEKGNKTQEGNFRNNKMTGVWKGYSPTSHKLSSTANYMDGEIQGNAASYDSDSTHKYIEVQPRPSYDLKVYLSHSLRYPKKAKKGKIQGKVIVKFVVNENGEINNVAVIQHVSPELDEEAIRAVSKMPPWEPGKQNGKPVKVYYTLPLDFRLN